MITSPAARPKLRVADWDWLLGLALIPFFMLPGWWSWLALALFGLSRLWRWRTGEKAWRSTGLDWAIGLVGLGALLGLSASLDLRLSLNRAVSLVAGLLLFYALSTGLTAAQVTRWGGRALVWLVGLAGLGSLLATDWGRGELVKIPLIYDHIPHIALGSLGSGASAEQEINPRVVGGALAMTLTLAWLQLALAPTPRQRWLVGLPTVFLTALLLLTQAPSALGGVVVAAGVAGLWYITRQRRWLFWLIGGLVGLLGLIGLFLVFLRLPVPTAEPTERIVFRMEMWLRSFDMLADKPFTGIGLNNFPQSLNNFYPTYSLGPEAHAHDLWLQTALDGGLIGLLGLLAVLVGVARLSYRAWQAHPADRAARYLVAGIAIGTAAWLIYGVIESETLAHKPALILWGMWALLAVLARDYTPPPGDTPLKWRERRWFWPAIVLAGLYLLVWLWLQGWDRLQFNLALTDTQRTLLNQSVPPKEAGATLYHLLDDPATTFLASGAAWDLGARLASRQSDFARASRYLTAETRLDSQNPVGHYIPAEWSFWANQPSPAPDPLLRLYRQWRIRYASDPLAYARLAVAQRLTCHPDLAQATLAEGLNLPSADFLRYLQANPGPACF